MLPAGAEAFRNDVPEAEIQLLDTGHFALEEDAGPIASHILTFLKTIVPGDRSAPNRTNQES